MSRRAARVAAVETLYAADLRRAAVTDLLKERKVTDPYGLYLVTEVERRRLELDDLIARHAVAWRPERMSPVDRNILRVAALELLEGDVPRAAVMDEAVELAKRFSGDEAARFVNGVLGGVLQELVEGGGAEGGSEGGRAEGSAGGGGGGSTGAGDGRTGSGGEDGSSAAGDGSQGGGLSGSADAGAASGRSHGGGPAGGPVANGMGTGSGGRARRESL